ncbi:MFS transporter [Dactylosporangium sp. AC04546]|uniref:MFS transporter n=1 Tax=Dactylosporangium sp. AC04546 TaxID=2862460 RepID=UPI001EDD6EFC|nr:MFS transporter [Dactylosporangium sp. AC04546]WVK80868.1 MFS transporter [Dactylosporangium sp. AC04546]
MSTASAVRSSTSTTADNPFAALRFPGYRIYLIGQSLASTGTWMASIAQDWLALQLTDSPTAVGITMALQFLPILFLGVHGGQLADRYPKRRILLITQTLNACLMGTLAVLTILGVIRIQYLFLIALLTGIVFAVDAPTRQVFATEVVPVSHLRQAVSLNATAFQATRLIGPAIATVLIGTAGTGWVFACNALCYLGPTLALLRLRPGDLAPAPPASREPRAFRTAARYVRQRPQVFWTVVLVGVIGMFGLNFPIVLTAIATETFHGTAGMYGLFNVVLAVGSAMGALAAGSGTSTRLRPIVLYGGLFGALQALAAAAPNLPTFLPLLAAMGFVNLAFQALANASVQLWVDPEMRGRVMGLYLLVFTGGTPLGAPVVGALTDHVGARFGMAVCGLVPAAAAGAIVLIKVWSRRRLRRLPPPPSATPPAPAATRQLCRPGRT